jgi:tyrosyl-tRNA synthetase
LKGTKKRSFKSITTQISWGINHFVHSAKWKSIKASNILFGNATADDLKELDEATFLEVFDGVPQAEIARDEIEAG